MWALNENEKQTEYVYSDDSDDYSSYHYDDYYNKCKYIYKESPPQNIKSKYQLQYQRSPSYNNYTMHNENHYHHSNQNRKDHDYHAKHQYHLFGEQQNYQQNYGKLPSLHKSNIISNDSKQNNYRYYQEYQTQQNQSYFEQQQQQQHQQQQQQQQQQHHHHQQQQQEQEQHQHQHQHQHQKHQHQQQRREIESQGDKYNIYSSSNDYIELQNKTITSPAFSTIKSPKNFVFNPRSTSTSTIPKTSGSYSDDEAYDMQNETKSPDKKTTNDTSKTHANVLKQWLEDHKDNPYPERKEKMKLAEQSGLTLHQVNWWFINKRRRNGEKKKMSKKQGVVEYTEDRYHYYHNDIIAKQHRQTLKKLKRLQQESQQKKLEQEKKEQEQKQEQEHQQKYYSLPSSRASSPVLNLTVDQIEVEKMEVELSNPPIKRATSLQFDDKVKNNEDPSTLRKLKSNFSVLYLLAQ
eukprot:Pgem_evm1s494